MSITIPKGKYIARAVEGGLGLTGTGKEQVAISFQLTTGEHAGKLITWHGYFTDLTTERTIESLRACGWTGVDLSDLTGIDANDVQLVIEDEQSQKEDGTPGDWYSKVRWVNKVGGGLGLKNQLDLGQAKAFAARMRGTVAAYDQANKSGTKPAVRPAQATRPNSGGDPRPNPPPPTGGPSPEDVPF